MLTDDDLRRVRALEEYAARVGRPESGALLEHTAVELVEHLVAAGLPVLLLKGPVLAARLYRSGEHRACTDVDLLLPSGVLAAAGQVLTGLGYANLSHARGIDDLAGVVSAATWFRDYGVPVDLHWRLPGCEAPAPVVWAALHHGREAIELCGSTVPAPGLPALALHVALHAAQHGTEDLKAMADLERALERWSREDWRAAAELADVVQATDALAAGLRLLPRGAALADALRLPAAELLAWRIAHRDDRPRGAFHIDAFRKAEGPRARAVVLRRSLFPTRRWIAYEYGSGEGLVRLATGYARHLLAAPGIAARAWRYKRRERAAGRGWR